MVREREADRESPSHVLIKSRSDFLIFIQRMKNVINSSKTNASNQPALLLFLPPSLPLPLSLHL